MIVFAIASHYLYLLFTSNHAVNGFEFQTTTAEGRYASQAVARGVVSGRFFMSDVCFTNLSI
jgi:hypothetical protein